ncbi:tRNA pseudouridine synthase B [Westerdykella ornata]|uniref:tRNA pseudouridine(55) synthase n=1 Tax=Westerdykella ornata TaxID=318751 RepID=A0A6A6JIG7_WESOR|nr:tRNA pseudouridine synthase B [Westerdykella ornata]KAF2275728.1 tRNA pseudouridine synthase B [Westerdykella ornata]
MQHREERVLEGVFAVSKPAGVSSADVLKKLQGAFASSQTFAPLLKEQPKRPSKGEENVFRMGHGGTLDPLAAGVLIVGIGRGTKQMQQYLACTKSYETTILFGASTDSYDSTGVVTECATHEHVNRELVTKKLELFKGKIMQVPPVYSALKINGIKACEYVRLGKELPRQLESREVHVEDCELVEWYDAGEHEFRYPGEHSPAPGPVARIRLTVSSGFYVRSFAHDLGLACDSRAHMVSLLRTRQAEFTTESSAEASGLVTALTYADLDAGEVVWGPKLKPQLEKWVDAHPVARGHINGRDPDTKCKLAQGLASRPKQRFRGEYVADSKKERIKQQGGKYKGKWGRKPEKDLTGTAGSSPLTT